MAVEPTSAGTIGITALFVALLGPFAGEYAVIVFAALAGAMWPLLRTKDTSSRRDGGWFLLKIVFTSVALTGGITYWIETNYGFPARFGAPVVAFAIGALGNGLDPVLQALGDGLSAMVRRVIGSKAGTE